MPGRKKQTNGSEKNSGRKGFLAFNPFLIILLVCLSFFVFITLRSIFAPSPEEEIRRTIRNASKVVEHRNLPKSLSYVSPAYRDDMGFDYQELAYIATQVFRAYPKISVSSKVSDISVTGDRAEVDLVAEILGILTPDDTEDLLAWRKSHRFLVTFQKEKKRWKMVETKKLPEPLE